MPSHALPNYYQISFKLPVCQNSLYKFLFCYKKIIIKNNTLEHKGYYIRKKVSSNSIPPNIAILTSPDSNKNTEIKMVKNPIKALKPEPNIFDRFIIKMGFS